MSKSLNKNEPIKKNKWYKQFIAPGIVALVLIILVLIFVKGEIDRFTFIMPIFAGFILYNILILPDED